MNLYNDKCEHILPTLSSKSVDAIICDLPYGTTACSWDNVIDFEFMWCELNRIIKPNGAIVLFGSMPFTARLVCSNITQFKYEWIWDKKIPSGMCNAKIQPMRQHETVLVFINGKSFYYPEMTQRDKPIKSGGMQESLSAGTFGLKKINKVYTEKYPTTIMSFDKVRKGSLHPTQKPVALMEYLVKTYTLEGQTVLDFAMGSGTTGVACKNLGRDFIGIEKEKEFFEIAENRINNVLI